MTDPPKPLIYILIGWGAFNAVCRLIPDAQWAKLPSWVQALIRLIRKLGPDGVGAYKQGQVIVEKAVESFRGPPPAALLVLAMLVGCGSLGKVEHPRHIARGAVLAVAYGVQIADHECFVKAKEIAGDALDERPAEPKPEIPGKSVSLSFLEQPHFAFTSTAKGNLDKAIALAEKCDQGYQMSRAGLLGAAAAVDTWQNIAERPDVGCGVYQGVAGLKTIVDACKSVGVKMPAAVDDAFTAADYVVGISGAACKR